MNCIQRRRRTDLPIAMVVVSALLLNGCHTMTRVAVPDSTPSPPNAAVFAELKVGDHVRITLRNGEKVSVTLAEVRADGLVGQGGRHIPYGDMAQLEERHVSRGRTAWLIVGIAGVVGLYVLYSYAVAVSSLVGGLSKALPMNGSE